MLLRARRSGPVVPAIGRPLRSFPCLGSAARSTQTKSPTSLRSGNPHPHTLLDTMELRIDPDQYARFEQALFTGRSEPSAVQHNPPAPLHHAPPARYSEAPPALAHRKAAGCGVRVWGCDTSGATHPDAAEAPESILRDTTALSSTQQQQSPGRDAFALLPSPGPPCVPQALRAQLRPRDGNAGAVNYSVLSAASTASTTSSSARRLRTPPRIEAAGGGGGGGGGGTVGVLPAAASATLSADASPPSVSPIAQLGSAATTTDTLHGRMARLIAALDRVGPPPQEPETPPPPPQQQQSHYRYHHHHVPQQQPRPVAAPTAELRAREVSCPRCHFCWMEGGGPVESAGTAHDTFSAASPPCGGGGGSGGSSGGEAGFGAVGAASASAAGYDVVSLGSPPPPQRRVAHASPAPPATPPEAVAVAASPLPPAVAAPAYSGMQFNESLPATPLPQPAQAKAPRVHRQPLLMSPMAAEPRVPVCEAAWDNTTPSTRRFLGAAPSRANCPSNVHLRRTRMRRKTRPPLRPRPARALRRQS